MSRAFHSVVVMPNAVNKLTRVEFEMHIVANRTKTTCENYIVNNQIDPSLTLFDVLAVCCLTV